MGLVLCLMAAAEVILLSHCHTVVLYYAINGPGSLHKDAIGQQLFVAELM